MGWRNLTVGSPSVLSLKNQQFLCSREGKPEVYAALEDIETLVIEHAQVTITAPLLVALQEAKVGVVFCDKKHMPVGMLQPLSASTRQLQIAQLQMDTSLPLKKQLWRHIVQRKILLQAQCLQRLHKSGSAELAAMAQRVQSGDAQNTEGEAAAYYFKRLLGDGFVREKHRSVPTHRSNMAFNYGYAVMRSVVAQEIVAHGLLPFWGLHHRNQVNSFNLADDLMEVLRPLVDAHVMQESWESKDTELSQWDRAYIQRILLSQWEINERQCDTGQVTHTMVTTLIQALEQRDPKILSLPEGWR